MTNSVRPFSAFAVIPAAGEGRRLGGGKLALPWGRTTVLGQTLAAWKRAPVTAIAVVIRPADDQLAEICRIAGVEPLIPPAPPPTMRDSVEFALRRIEKHYQPNPSDVWLLAPADMPFLSVEIVAALLTAHDPDQSQVLVPTLQGKRGHPVLAPWSSAVEVFNLPADQGVNIALRRHPQREIACDDYVQIAPGSPFADLDTPADYEGHRPH